VEKRDLNVELCAGGFVLLRWSRVAGRLRWWSISWIRWQSVVRERKPNTETWTLHAHH